MGLATPTTPAADSPSCFQLGTTPQLLDAMDFYFQGLHLWPFQLGTQVH